MYLKSVSIKGFKSFAKKTELEFQPGISMIVGPNGSGKSNITDAIQWVLGEQSPSNLRGSAMQDVIFAGSLGRKALGLAEVTLTIDNTDKALNLDFSEVTVTRRILRNGENFYFINSVPCRLLDIFELLHDSGLGRQTHSIIGQGRLEEVISSGPEEKRILLEEAAGVLKHKKRKERALRKLISTEDNLKRAKDILREINQQVKPLEEQVSKAKAFTNLNKKLKDLEIAFLVKKISNLKKKAEAIEENQNSIQDRCLPLERELQELTRKINIGEQKQEELARKSKKFQNYKVRVTNLKVNLENLFTLEKHKNTSAQKSVTEIQEQFSTFENQIKIKESQIENLKSQIEKLETEKSHNLKAIQVKRKESEKLIPNRQQIEDNLNNQQQKINQLESDIKQLQEQKLTKLNDLTFVEKEKQKHKLKIEKLSSEIKDNDKKILSITKNIEENDKKIEIFEKQILKLIEKRSRFQNQLKQNEGQLSSLLNRTFDEAQKLLKIAKSKSKSGFKKELADCEARLVLLKQDIDLATTDKDDLKHLLSESLQKNEEIQKEVSNLKESRSKLQADLWFLHQTKDQQNQAIELAKKSIKITNLTKAKLEKKKEQLEERLDLLTKEKIPIEKSLDALKQLLNKEVDKTHVFKLALTELNYQAQNINQQLLSLRNQLSEVKEEHGSLKKQHSKCLRKITNIENRLSLKAKFLPTIEFLKEVSCKLEEHLAKKEIETPHSDLLKNLREKEKSLNEELKDLEIKNQKLLLEKANLKTNLESLADTIIQEYDLALETAIQNYSQIGTSKELISSVKHQINEIGPVNAVAQEQFTELDKRRIFLEKQIEDLSSSKHSINKIIRAIDKKIKEVLLNAYQEISQNFKQLFSQLFPGGQAELILTGDNIFESGLEVKAQPYGKSLKKLSLLSGGETALTALALLFAVYHTRPSPFYVLDEVEASLDDINLQRFIRLLREMKGQTQFIVITHQRRTMEVADCLYGLTMQADGISKVVSQKLSSADKKKMEEVNKKVSVS